MHFVSLGDSITYGEGASRPSLAYPSVLSGLLNQRRGFRTCCGEILAQPGWTSRTLASAVAASTPVPLQSAKCVIIWIGGDDLAAAALASASQRNISSGLSRALASYGFFLQQTVREVQRVTSAPIFLCTQYNPFPNSPLAVEGIGLLNQAIHTVSSHTKTTVVPSGDWFTGRQPELIAGYRTGTLKDVMRHPIPIHPNDRGHRVIAQGLFSTVAPIV